MPYTMGEYLETFWEGDKTNCGGTHLTLLHLICWT